MGHFFIARNLFSEPVNTIPASGLTKFFSNGTGEFIEELAQQIVSPAVTELSFKGDQGAYEHPFQLAVDAVYSSLVSFFAGGIGGTVSENLQGVRVRGNAQADGRNFVNLNAKTDVRTASAGVADADMNANSDATSQSAAQATVQKLTSRPDIRQSQKHGRGVGRFG